MLPSEKIPLGQIVVSLSGKDAGQQYVVVGNGKPPFLQLADGRNRIIAKPKKKNVRHVQITRSIAHNVAEKLRNRVPVSDLELRQAILNMTTPDTM